MELDIDKIYDNYVSKLKADVEKTKKAQENPLFIIKELFNPEEYQPYYSSLIKLIKSSGMKHHDIQEYLSDKLVNYLQRLDNEVEVKLSYPNSYPSNFSIIYLDKTIMSFDIYNHSFGSRIRLSSVDYLEESIKNDKGYINTLNKRISKYKDYNDNLFRMVGIVDYESKKRKFSFVFKDLYYILFKYKQIKTNIPKVIKDTEKKIKRIEKEIEGKREKIKDIKTKKPLIDKKYSEWKNRFLEWGYKDLDDKVY